MTNQRDADLKAEVTELIEDYIVRLDSRDPTSWLDLFTEDGYYSVLRYSEFEKGNNTLIMGEDLGRLKARVEMGLDLDKRRSLHMISGVRVVEGEPDIQAVVNFALWMDGKATYAGHYHLDLRRVQGAVKIKTCQVVIDNIVITDAVYLPI